MKREELNTLLTEWEQFKKANWYHSDAIDVEKYLMEKFAEIKALPLPPSEGAEKVQRCPVCMGRGLVPNSFYATTSGIGSTTQTYLPEKCRTCNGAGVIILPYPKLQPTAEGAEAIIESIVESLGDPIYIHHHVFEIRPYTVEHKTEWWIFHKEGGSGEPLAQWLNKFAALHAQKMTQENLREELIAYDKYASRWIDNYRAETAEDCVDEYLKSKEQ